MTRKIGEIQVKKRRLNGEPILIIFVEPESLSSLKIARNFNWNKLKVLDRQIVEAWGKIYYEFADSKVGKRRVFYIKKFVIKRSGVNGEVLLAELGRKVLFRRMRNPWAELEPHERI